MAPPPKGVQLDLTDFGDPELSIYADAITTSEAELSLTVTLRQQRNKDSVPAAHLVAHFDAVVGNLWRSSEEFFRSEVRLMEQWKLKLPPIREAPVVDAEPLFLVNVFRITRAGLDATMDCYYVTPNSMHRVSKGAGKLKIEPVIRVQLPAPLLVSLLDYISKRVEAMQGRIGYLLPRPE